ncbi:biofilm PGA synthesis protein PgaD [Cupriavidus gilardii J11]|uniref:Biofilm PGA synthesis protein PgaD n=1 Tax=Cupriavidus gilardii J11 TaxID=936133 RepID=A0A562BW43_9BURK|nr:poly-beta-1,6-N-acetyl-D-glucosamine biosynthesis protein PgaD [Cupriavidus gilardii]TWG88903.1 biofilm PGA synthesis protein PgaD [Cupriavidus gilardii J11]
MKVVMNPDEMIVRSQRSRLGWLIDALLTALAWIGFGWLCASGVHAVLQAADSGPGVPVLSALLPTMDTLAIYVVVAVINGIVLLAWARYNQYRFSGLDRRRAIPALGKEELARSFGVSAQRLQAMQEAKVVVVVHQEDGGILDVRLG